MTTITAVTAVTAVPIVTAVSAVALVLGTAWRWRRAVPADRRTGPPQPGPSRRAGPLGPVKVASLAVVAVVVAGIVVAGPAGAVAPAVLVLARLRARRSRALAASAVRVARLPDVADLAALAASAGLTVPLVLDVLADHGDATVRRAVGEVRRATAAGERLADALDLLTRPEHLGPPARPLVAVMAAASRHGSPLASPLAAVAREARHERRRLVETAARRLPVTLLFPLVLCTLPALVLLTVVPVVVAALGTAGLS